MTEQSDTVTIRDAFRSLNRFHVVLLAILFVSVLVVPIGLWFLFHGGETRSTDLARYTEFLQRFPTDLASVAPAALPLDAKSPLLQFYDSGDEGIGLRNLYMKVGFAIEPREAAKMILQARTALKDKPLRWDSANRVILEHSLGTFDVQANLSTGDVTIELQSD